MIKTDLSGFVVTVHEWASEQYVQSHGLTAFTCVLIVTTNPSGTGLNPLNIKWLDDKYQQLSNEVLY